MAGANQMTNPEIRGLTQVRQHRICVEIAEKRSQKKEARSLCLGMSVSEFNEHLEMMLDTDEI